MKPFVFSAVGLAFAVVFFNQALFLLNEPSDTAVLLGYFMLAALGAGLIGIAGYLRRYWGRLT